MFKFLKHGASTLFEDEDNPTIMFQGWDDDPNYVPSFYAREELEDLKRMFQCYKIFTYNEIIESRG